MRAACLAAFHDEIKARTADVFYVRITKDMTVDEKRHRYNDAKALFEQAKLAHSNLKPEEIKLMLIKERLACMSSHGNGRIYGLTCREKVDFLLTCRPV